MEREAEEKQPCRKESSRIWQLVNRMDEASFYAGMKFGALGFSLAYFLNSGSKGVHDKEHSKLMFTLVGFAFGVGMSGQKQHTKVRKVARTVDEKTGMEIIEETGQLARENTIPTLLTHTHAPKNEVTETGLSVCKTLMWGYVVYLTAPIVIIGGTVIVCGTIVLLLK